MSEGLLIRADPVEHVLRSVGDPPNGILCVIVPDDVASWAIDGKFQPSVPDGAEGVVIDARASNTGEGLASTPITPDDLVAACEGASEVLAIVQMLGGYLASSLQLSIGGMRFEFLRSHVDLAIATRDALEHAGYISRGAES